MVEEKRNEHEKESDEIRWENKPKNLFGWVLYMIPKKYWKIVVGVVALFITVVVLWEYNSKLTQNELEVNSKFQLLEKKKKIENWNSSDDPAIKIALMRLWNKRRDVPEEIWDSFNSIKNTEILIAMAQNPWVPIEIENRLLNNESLRVRVAAILNKNRNRKGVVQLLSKDKSAYVRRSVVWNSNAPVELLKQLATDASTRSAVATNSKTPVELLKQLTTDKSENVICKAISSIISLPESEWIK